MSSELKATPRTDEVELHYRDMEYKDAPLYVVPADFARTLEREGNELRERVAQLSAERDALRENLQERERIGPD